jgi:hypothetical protein
MKNPWVGWQFFSESVESLLQVLGTLSHRVGSTPVLGKLKQYTENPENVLAFFSSRV